MPFSLHGTRIVLLALSSFIASTNVSAAEPNVSMLTTVDLLTGDTKLACEAILCLSSGVRPGECQPSLNRFFSIKHKKAWKTIRDRKNFLQLCPKGDGTNAPVWNSLIDVISTSAENCSAEGLNRYTATGAYDSRGEMSYTRRDNRLPAFCQNYWGHDWTYFPDDYLPKYVGTPELRGFWVEPDDKKKGEQRHEEWTAEYEAYLHRLARYHRCLSSCSGDDSCNCSKPSLSWSDPLY